MHIRATRVRIAVLAAMAAGTIAQAQVRLPPAPAPAAPATIIDRWLAAVHAHTPGELDDAVKTVAAWPEEYLAYTHNFVSIAVSFLNNKKFADAIYEPQVRRLGIREPPDAVRVLKRGAALHADIAMLAPDLAPASRRAFTGGSAGSSVVLRDGEALGIEGNLLHWALGRTLVRGLQPIRLGEESGSPEPAGTVDPFVRHWFRATTAYLAHSLMRAEELAHSRQGLLAVPDDPVLLLLSGAMHEQFGSPVVQTAIRGAKLPAGVEIAVGSASSELNRAKDRLEKALAIDPGLAEAHIRLGRVLGQRGDRAAAIRSLTRGEELAVEPRWKYFAALFLGHEQEQAKRYAEAREAYGRAAKLYPRAQSPRLALGRLATELGDRDAAAAAARALLNLPSDLMARDDPWWSYDIRQRSDLDRYLTVYYEIARAVR